MGRRKYNIETKVRASEDYLAGRKSAQEISAELNMGKSGRAEVARWAAMYKEQGIEGFHPSKRNRSYTAEFKRQAVAEYLSGQGSQDDICRKYGISNRSTFAKWIKVYNSSEELRDYDPKPEVYAAMPKKTSVEERVRIAEYCIDQGKDYKGTAERYGLSYGQIYNWVKKYLAEGSEGLADRRGHRKSDDEVSEIEQLKRENARLRRQLQDEERLVLLLKKVKEFEGM